MNPLQLAIRHAYQADDNFTAACRRDGYRDRWSIPVPCNMSAALRLAYDRKVSADQYMHEMFVQSRL